MSAGPHSKNNAICQSSCASCRASVRRHAIAKLIFFDFLKRVRETGKSYARSATRPTHTPDQMGIQKFMQGKHATTIGQTPDRKPRRSSKSRAVGSPAQGGARRAEAGRRTCKPRRGRQIGSIASNTPNSTSLLQPGPQTSRLPPRHRREACRRSRACRFRLLARNDGRQIADRNGRQPHGDRISLARA